MKVKIVDKKIILPEIKLFKNDFGLDTIVFSIDKTYNGKDLSDLSAYLNYKRNDGASGKILLEKVVNDKSLALTYPVGNEITGVEGQVDMQISFSDEQNYNMSTEIFSIDVLKRINGAEQVESGNVDISVMYQSFVSRTEFANHVESMEELPEKVKDIESSITLLEEETEKKALQKSINLKELLYDGDGNLISQDRSYRENFKSNMTYEINCIDESNNKFIICLNSNTFERGKFSTAYLKTGATEVSIEVDTKIKIYGDGVIDNLLTCETHSQYEIIVYYNGAYFEVFSTKIE